MNPSDSRESVDPVRRAAFMALAAGLGAIAAAWIIRRIGMGGWIPNWGRFWGAGVIVDLASLLLLWFSTRRPGGPMVAIPGIGWILYAVSCITAPGTIIIPGIAASSLWILPAKCAEFLGLSLFHVLLQFRVPRFFLPKPTDH